MKHHKKFSDLDKALVEHYDRFESGYWWLDEFNQDYVYVATFKYISVRFNECRWIANFIKKWLKENNINLHHIFVGPFVWDLRKG